MKKSIPIIIISLSVVLVVTNYIFSKATGAPPYEVTTQPSQAETDIYKKYANWKRPEGPPKVALQAGHYKSNEAPDELSRLRTNTGTSGGGKSEWEVNLSIATATAEILRTKGITVEILPATVPPAYWADIFLAIHADGSLDTSSRGFKLASPWVDITGKSTQLVTFIENAYGKATGLIIDPNITRNMRGYYAFGWWRYEHAIHPMTTGAIIETGFLTSPTDRKILIDNHYKSANGIAEGITDFLAAQKLL